MIGIVVVGHGEFAKGLASSVELIAGKQEKFETVSFLEGQENELMGNIKEAIEKVDDGDGVLVFTDLKGGTPFRESVVISVEHGNCEVLTGTNIAMLLEALLTRSMADSLKEFAQDLEETGRSQVYHFKLDDLEQEEETDGI